MRLLISGKVQGVLYRDFVRREAEKLNISGYTNNLSDGTVEIIAVGKESDLTSFIAACKKGPLMAFVKNIEMTDHSSDEEFDGFDVRY